MTTNAKIGHGVLFKIANGDSPSVMTVIGEITSVTPPAIARDAIDATHSQSAEKWREFIAGLKDGGEASADINFVPGSAGHELLMDQLDTDAPSECEIDLPDGSKFEFDGILTGYAPSAPIDDKMTATVTFKVSGKPVFTEAA
jgi:predicted secreted protein